MTVARARANRNANPLRVPGPLETMPVLITPSRCQGGQSSAGRTATSARRPRRSSAILLVSEHIGLGQRCSPAERSRSFVSISGIYSEKNAFSLTQVIFPARQAVFIGTVARGSAVQRMVCFAAPLPVGRAVSARGGVPMTHEASLAPGGARRIEQGDGTSSTVRSDHRLWNVFRRKHESGLCCAVPSDRSVPDFLFSGEWMFSGTGSSSGADTPNLQQPSAAWAADLNGFYLFMCFSARRRVASSAS